MRLVAACLFLLSAAAPAAADPSCSVAAATPWMSRWIAAWEFTSRTILDLPDAPAPAIVFFDSACAYSNAAALVGGPAAPGPAFFGAPQAWHAAAHGDSLTIPGGKRLEVALMSFTGADRATGPYFVMAAPGYWEQKTGNAGNEAGLTGVFLHEFAHTRQVRGLAHVIGPLDSTWKYPEELNDDAVQQHFGSDSTYAAAYLAERDLFYRAAAAADSDSVRVLAARALAMLEARHARWFTGDRAEFALVDDTFLSMEGAGQWTAVAWLSHPQGGGMTREAAIARMLGKRRWWVQDESLAIFLVLERLLPGWPRLVFAEPSAGVVELLARATR